MKFKIQNSNQNEDINLEELEVEGDILSLPRHPIDPAKLEEVLVEAPESSTFDKDRYLLVSQGFTPGAVQNLITISRHALRVYSVTNTSITHSSCLKIPEKVSKVLFLQKSKSGRVINSIASAKTLKLFFQRYFSKNMIFSIEVEQKTGKMLQFRELDLTKSRNYSDFKIQPRSLPVIKNSKLEFYLSSFIRATAELGFYRVGSTGKARKWLDLSKQLRSSKDLKHSRNNQFFETKSQETVLNCYQSSSHLRLDLIRLRTRKVLVSRKISILNFLTEETLKQLLGSYPEENLGQPHPVQIDQIWEKSLGLKKVFYEPKTQSLILELAGELRALILNLGNPFWGNDLHLVESSKPLFLDYKNGRIALKFTRNGLVGGLEGGGIVADHLLRFNSAGKDGSERRLIQLIQLEDTKLIHEKKPFRDHGGFMDFEEKANEEVIYQDLSRGKALIVNSLCASVYDFEEGRLIDQLTHTCLNSSEEREEIQLAGDLIILGDPKTHLHFLKTQKERDKIKIVKMNTIFVHDLFYEQGLLPDQRQLPTFHQLQNGNYLMLYKIIYRIRQGYEIGEGPAEQGSVEIDGQTLQLLKSETRDNSNKIDPDLNAKSQIHLVSGFLIFAAREKKQKGFQMYTKTHLTLADHQFEVLDQSKEAWLTSNDPIGLISTNRIVSMGVDNNIYLHQIDAEQEKLVLLKELKFDNGQHVVSFSGLRMNPYVFSCLVKLKDRYFTFPTMKEKRLEGRNHILLNFDPDLKLASYIHHDGILDQFKHLLHTSEGQLLGVWENQGSHGGGQFSSSRCIYMLDLASHDFYSGSQLSSTSKSTLLGQGHLWGDPFMVQIYEEGIKLLRLNQ